MLLRAFPIDFFILCLIAVNSSEIKYSKNQAMEPFNQNEWHPPFPGPRCGESNITMANNQTMVIPNQQQMNFQQRWMLEMPMLPPTMHQLQATPYSNPYWPSMQYQPGLAPPTPKTEKDVKAAHASLDKKRKRNRINQAKLRVREKCQNASDQEELIYLRKAIGELDEKLRLAKEALLKYEKETPLPPKKRPSTEGSNIATSSTSNEASDNSTSLTTPSTIPDGFLKVLQSRNYPPAPPANGVTK